MILLRLSVTNSIWKYLAAVTMMQCCFSFAIFLNRVPLILLRTRRVWAERETFLKRHQRKIRRPQNRVQRQQQVPILDDNKTDLKWLGCLMDATKFENNQNQSVMKWWKNEKVDAKSREIPWLSKFKKEWEIVLKIERISQKLRKCRFSLWTQNGEGR